MTRIYVALLEPDHPPLRVTKVSPDQEVSPESPSRQFIRPVRPPVTHRDITDLSQTESPKKLVRFGVIVENFRTKIVSEVVRDILNLVSSLPASSRLVLVSPNSNPFWEKLRSTVPVDFQFGGFETVSTWKIYWETTKPTPPKGVIPKFEKFLGEVQKRMPLRPGPQSIMPVNPDAGRMLPNNFNPLFRTQPTLGPVSMTPQLYLWSARAPSSGEKVMVPETESVETIASISGTMARVGPNKVSLDMDGYEFFQPLDIWVSRSYKKEKDGSKD